MDTAFLTYLPRIQQVLAELFEAPTFVPINLALRIADGIFQFLFPQLTVLHWTSVHLFDCLADCFRTIVPDHFEEVMSNWVCPRTSGMGSDCSNEQWNIPSSEVWGTHGLQKCYLPFIHSNCNDQELVVLYIIVQIVGQGIGGRCSIGWEFCATWELSRTESDMATETDGSAIWSCVLRCHLDYYCHSNLALTLWFRW